MARTDEVRVLLMTIFFYILVCNALYFILVLRFREIGQNLRIKLAKYRVCLSLCLDAGAVHCVTFTATPITAQLWFIHFWKAQVIQMCIPGFVFRYSKKIRRNCRPKVHYTAMSCSRRGPLRYVCGQTIDPTAMICTFLKSPTDLDVHHGIRFLDIRKNFAGIGVKKYTIRLCHAHEGVH